MITIFIEHLNFLRVLFLQHGYVYRHGYYVDMNAIIDVTPGLLAVFSLLPACQPSFMIMAANLLT